MCRDQHSSTPFDDDDDEESAEEVDEPDDDKDGDDESDDESHCNSVLRLLRERSGLQELNLEDCRAYLRKHGLRITGTKAECIQRIMEHWWSVATSHIKLLAHLLC